MSAFVLGCHRSGTSLLAGILRSAIGADLHEHLGGDLPSAADNPRGFSESENLVALNEHLLDISGASWHHPFLARPDWEEPETLSYLRSLQTWLPAHIGQDRWVDKDPRLCLTRDAITHILLADIPAIAILRHPLEVAESLYLRNGFPFSQGLLIWMLYNWHICTASSRLPHTVILMDQLVSADSRMQSEVHRLLFAFLADAFPALTIDKDVLAEALRTHCDLSLLHCHEQSFPKHDVHPSTLSLILDVWSTMRNAIIREQPCELAPLMAPHILEWTSLLAPYGCSEVRGHLYYRQLHSVQYQLKIVQQQCSRLEEEHENLRSQWPVRAYLMVRALIRRSVLWIERRCQSPFLRQNCARIST